MIFCFTFGIIIALSSWCCFINYSTLFNCFELFFSLQCDSAKPQLLYKCITAKISKPRDVLVHMVRLSLLAANKNTELIIVLVFVALWGVWILSNVFLSVVRGRVRGAGQITHNQLRSSADTFENVSLWAASHRQAQSREHALKKNLQRFKKL